jgi:hypothetical protein
MGEDLNELDLLIRAETGSIRDDFKGAGEKIISREKRHPFREGFMKGGPTPSQIVVVHAGKIVVDERIGVDHLNRAGWIEGGLGVFRGCEDEERAESLARG